MKTRLLFPVLLGATASLTIAQDLPNEFTEDSSTLSHYSSVQSALHRWRAAHGETWRVEYDAWTQSGHFLYGGSAQPESWPVNDGDFIELARHAIEQSQGIHRIEPAALVDDSVTFLPLGLAGSTDKLNVRFRQVVDGVEVDGGTVNVLFDLQGRLLSIDSDALPGHFELQPTPTRTGVAVRRDAEALFVAERGLPVTRSTAAKLMIDKFAAGKTLEPRLAWEVGVFYQEPGTEPAGTIYRLDAIDGTLLSRRDGIHHRFDVSGNVQAMATPGVYPDGISNLEVAQNMPHMTVTSAQGNAVTDADGNFVIVGASAPVDVTVQFSGTYANVNNQASGDYSLTTTLSSSSGNNVLMNPSSTDFVTAEANALLWIGLMRDWTRGINPADTTSDFLAPANVNVADICNAYYDGVSVNFFQPGLGCANTAYSSVVLHEMGHWLNDRYGSGNGADGFGEGNADVYSMYRLDDAIVGRDFCGVGCIVRDGNNTRQFCGDSNPGCYGAVHTDGEVLMGALWKVRTRLKNAHGAVAGGAIADTLFNSWMNGYDDGQIRTIIETHWLVLDDDNGNINDGTPHYAEIDGGFRDQGFPGVELALVGVSNVTELGDQTDEAGPYSVSADIAALYFPPLSGADLFYSVDGGSFTQVAMIPGSGSTRLGDIPGQPSPATVRYYVRGTDSLGNSNTYPSGAPGSTLSFIVGIETIFFADDFESGANGWTHSSVGETQDDWMLSSEVGANGAFGLAGDPTAAVSGTSIWGNDLGPPGFDGAYQGNVDNSLLSPVIDCSAAVGATLRFERWLTIESGQYDQARVLVNGTEVWVNPATGDTVDTSWVPMEIDISSIADGVSAVQLEWKLETDTFVEFGGWNIDDVEISSLGPVAGISAAFVGGPTSGVAPLAVDFSDLSSGGPDTWSWNFGDGGGASNQNPTHTYNTPGLYPVTLTASGAGDSDTITKVDYIDVQAPAPVADFSGSPTSGDAPLTVGFSDLSTGQVDTWSWDFGDGGSSSAQDPSHTYNTPGLYPVTLTASGAGGSDAVTKVDYINVQFPAPVADFSGSPTSGDAPLTVGFSDLSAGPVDTWSWDFGDGGTSTAQNPTHVYNATGSYTVGLTVANTDGSDTLVRSSYITVSGAYVGEGYILSKNADFSTDDRVYTTSDTIYMNVWSDQVDVNNMRKNTWELRDSSQNKTSQDLTNHGDGTFTGSFALSGLPSAATSWEFRGTLNSKGRARFNPTDFITVIAEGGPPPSADYSATNTSGSAPLTVSFADLSSGGPTAWAWDFGDGGTSTMQHPSHVYSSAGSYTVSLTVFNGGGSDTLARTNYITVSGGGPITVTDISPNSMSAGSSVQVVITGSGFASGASVTFENGSGGTPTASDQVVLDSETITATIAVGNNGPRGARVWDVRVTNTDASTGILPAGFTVNK